MKINDIITFENNGKGMYGKILEINCNEVFIHEVIVNPSSYQYKDSKFWVNENDIQCNLGNCDNRLLIDYDDLNEPY